MQLLARLAAAWLLVVLSGCPSSSFEQRSLPPPPDPTVAPEQLSRASLYVPGEYLAWSVKWKSLAGGRTQYVIGEPGTLDGHAAIIAKSETRGDGLVAVFKHIRDELTTTIHLETGAPAASAGTVEEGREVERLEIEFGADGYRATLRENGDSPVRWRQPLPEPGAHADDLHSAMAHMRLWRPSSGTRGVLYAQSGQSFYRLELVADGHETVETEAGAFDTVRIEGTAHLLTKRGKPPRKAKQRRFTLWFSDDAHHLPVRVVAETTFGDVRAELVEYARPDGATPLVLTHRAD